MDNIKSFLTNRKKSWPLALGVILVVFLLLDPHIVSADLATSVQELIGNIVSGLVWVGGKILVVLINLVIWVAQYNGFINSQAVSTGWTILRDVCNMFFILILLVIAFATTLNIESYGMKKLLKDFILAAILINFSKLICGVIIDFAQVIMLTFVNGFRDIGGGNLADMLGITKLLSQATGACSGNASLLGVMGTYILALLYVIVGIVVILAILFMLIMRIVMIWMYVVLSPLAYLLSVLPDTKRYAGMWWSQFAEAVASGPILAFFIWLSFASATVGSKGQDIIGIQQGSATANESNYLKSINESCVGVSDAGTADSMLKFLISIGLLLGGLMITKQAGGMVGGIAGGALGKIQGWGGTLGKKLAIGAPRAIAKGAGKVAWGAAKATGRQGLNLGGKTMGALGSKLESQGYGRAGAVFSGAGNTMSGIYADKKKKRDDAKATKKKKILEKLGVGAEGQKALQDWRKKSPIAGGMAGNLLAGAPLSAAAVLPAAGVRWLGGKAQNWMSNRQRKKDVKQTGQLVQKLETKVSTPYKNKVKRTDFLNQEEANEKQKIQKQWDSDKTNPLINRTPEGTASMNERYQKQMDAISERYKSEREHAEATYKKDATPDQLKNDERNAADLERAKQYHEEAKQAATYLDKKNKLKDLKKGEKDEKTGKRTGGYDQKFQDLENKRNMDTRLARNNFKGDALDKELKRINDEYSSNLTTLRTAYNDDVKKINDRFDSLKNVKVRGPVKKAVNWGGKMAQQWNPNSVVDAALKKGTKEYQDANNLLQALADKQDPGIFKRSNFTGAVANGGDHEKAYAALAAQTDDLSKNAYKGVLETIRGLKTKPGGLSKGEIEFAEGLKQGIARHYQSKPENKSLFQTLISELDTLDTGNNKGKIKVSDFESKMK